MRKLFPMQYWLSWLFAAIFFAAIFPYTMGKNGDIFPIYWAFCILLNGLSTVLIRTVLFRVWVRRFYSDSIRVYACFLAIAAFCHLVFTQMHPAGWVCIGVMMGLLLYFGWIKWQEWKKERQEA